MKLSDLFKPKWNHRKATVRLAALANTRDPEVLYRIATQSPDERLRLEAAHRLNDPTLLIRLARSANDANIRFEAALLVRDQATLAAIALDAWHTDSGKLAVVHIDNAMLLRRLARSAKQEVIRVAAALKLKDPGLLKQIAQSSEDMNICWQIANHLDDPYLFCKVANVSRANSNLAKLSDKAYSAYLKHLDHRRQCTDVKGLSAVIKTAPLTLHKIDAFLRIPADSIQPEVIHHLSKQDFKTVSNPAIHEMFTLIQQANWRVHQSAHYVACRQCNGEGQFSLRSMTAGSSHLDHDRSVCTGCDGLGQQLIHTIICEHHQHPEVFFHLPVNQSSLPKSEPSTNQKDAVKPGR